MATQAIRGDPTQRQDRGYVGVGWSWRSPGARGHGAPPNVNRSASTARRLPLRENGKGPDRPVIVRPWALAPPTAHRHRTTTARRQERFSSRQPGFYPLWREEVVLEEAGEVVLRCGVGGVGVVGVEGVRVERPGIVEIGALGQPSLQHPVIEALLSLTVE